MFRFKQANSPRLIHTLVNQLVGEDEARRFWTTYRNTYITSEDIDFIKKSGFNSVRIPFNYWLFVADADPARLEGPGYELLDRVVGWCRDAGLFSSWICTLRRAGRRGTTSTTAGASHCCSTASRARS